MQADWLREGLSTTPAEREKTQRAALSAFGEVGHGTGSHLFIWVDSPMAGVIASTFIGFALEEPLKPKLTKLIDDAVAVNVPAAQQIREGIDQQIWHVARKANAQWQRMKEDIGNYTWHQVWQTVGDPVYGQYFDEDARASGGLFEENLKPWADAMMEGQFGAGTMAQLDALSVLNGPDLAPFEGLQRVARNCC